MNFEQLIAGAIHHRRTKDLRRHRMDMERDAARHSRTSAFQAQQNQQRFAQQQFMQQRSHENQMMRWQQQQHFTQQQQQQQEDAEAAQIDADINAVREKRRNNEISAEEERTLLWKLENKKRGLQTAGGPPPDTPKYVGTDRDVGDHWWEETDDLKPDGTKWRVQYTRDSRGSIKIIRDERKEWEERDNARRQQDREDAAETRAQAKDERDTEAEKRRVTNEERAQNTAERAQASEERKVRSEERTIEQGERDQKKEDDDALYTRLERRAKRDAQTNLRAKWQEIQQSDDRLSDKKRAARAAGISDFKEGPTKEDIEAEEARLLDEYLNDSANEATDLASTEQAVPFNADAGMYEVVV